MNFRKLNNLIGWLMFATAALVYLLTMEPTVSFWDCGEFISAAFKIEVGHSPGAPLFMMIQRLFGIMAGSNLESVAKWINSWSALASAGTILFLFWTITHFACRLLVKKDEEPQGNQLWMILGAGVVGALAYTFSDTFWFSAVEAEVYATSSLFTAVVFWAVLKWEHVADEKYADRWLVLIAYLMGLSVGVHLLNLLTIPAVGMVYYFRRFKPTISGAIIAFLVSCGVLAFVQYGVIQWVPSLAAQFDLFFVNSLRLPFDSGALFFILLLIAALVAALVWAQRTRRGHWHTAILSLLFVLIGFSSYMAPMIRSRADVPIDMTNPDNAISLLSYLKREQFGSQPLFSGPDFTSKPVEYAVTGHSYSRSEKDGKDYYLKVGDKIKQEFAPSDTRFFPRVHNINDASHIRFYREYLGLAEGERPSSADNYKFFFNYQINWMWWRYFMWNYAGRQNDFQGQGEPKNGNWITGIKAFDKNVLGVGDIDLMSKGYRDNPARNQFYLLPFLLGVLGLVYQFNRHKKDGIITLVLFFFTGIAIAIYLNMTPLQPRERDYAFVGSMYAFAIWIGLGVLMVNQYLSRWVKGRPGVVLSIALCLIAVPALMAKEGWDDHDRSKKTLAWASAYNVLSSVDSNAILFTFGDNDTYPLWYIQEVEGFRKDVRLINMSLLGIDWYIDQLNYRVNDAMPVDMIWDREHYLGDRRNYLMYYNPPNIPEDRYFDLIDICQFFISDDANAKISMVNQERQNFLPTRNFSLPTPSMEELIARGMIAPEDTAIYRAGLQFTFPKEVAYKGDLAVFNILAAVARNGWDRPVYFGGGLPRDNYVGLNENLLLEGLVYRVVPYARNFPMPGNFGEVGMLSMDKSLDLFMNTYQWGNAHRDDVYFDEKNRLMFAAYRINAARIATELGMVGRKEEAVALLDKVMENISESSYLYDATAFYMAVAYYEIDELEKAAALSMKLARNSEDDIQYVLSLSKPRRQQCLGDVQRDLSIMNALSGTAQKAGDTTTAQNLQTRVTALSEKVNQNMDFSQMR